MYAIIEVGTKQYKVTKGDTLDVEKQNTPEGKELTLGHVLLLNKEKKVEIGQPYLKGVQVKAEVIGCLRGKKAVSFKYRRRKSKHWKKGHRQELTRIKIKEIETGS